MNLIIFFTKLPYPKFMLAIDKGGKVLRYIQEIILTEKMKITSNANI